MSQNTIYYKIWNVVKLVICLITLIVYPFYTVNGFPKNAFFVIVCLEGVFAIEMCIKFCLQRIDERGVSQKLPLEIVAQKYF
jgi:hypothetical protein